MRRTVLVLLCALSALAAAPPETRALWDAWPRARVSPPDPWSLKHVDLRRALAALQTRHPGLFAVDTEGRSAEGRAIPLLKVGRGPRGVLLWSQMHGDEPTATSALLDLLSWMGAHPGDPLTRRIQSELTLWIIPMLNPDGAERTQRRNAQEIDLNRDALRLAAPESRFLKAVRDRVKPELGFNLHNQNPFLRAGKSGEQVAFSLLAVPGDEAHTETPGVRLAKQVGAQVAHMVEPWAAGRVARYDMDYTERAFGDSMTRWGTPTLLVETGGWAGPGEAERLVRLHTVALLGTLGALADGRVRNLDPQDYDRLPLNHRDALASLVLRDAQVLSGRGLPPFRADLSFLVPTAFSGDAPRRREPSLQDMGDLSYARGLEELDATGLLALPWPATPGVADWNALRGVLEARGLVLTDESRLRDALHTLGDAALARPGHQGPVLLYASRPDGTRALVGAVLRGRLVGEALASKLRSAAPER